MENNTVASSLSGNFRLVRLAELAVVVLASIYFVPLVESLSRLAGFEIPVMPLLRRTYLFFLFVLLLFAWLRLRGESFAEFGVVKRSSWPRIVGQGVLVLLACLLWDTLGRPLVDPLIATLTHTSPTLAEQHFASVKGNLPMVLYLIPFGWLFGGIGEELFYRGYIMTRVAQVLGEGRWAWVAAVFIQAIPFALGHAYQGPVGVVAIYVLALITGAATLLWGRTLYPSMIAHGLQDTIGFLALYAGIAHA